VNAQQRVEKERHMTQLRFKDYLVVAGGVLLIALSLTFAAMAADDNAGRKTIQGHYAVTGAGHNLVSTTGFDANFKPNPCPPAGNPCLVFQDIQIFSGDYTFNKDGMGSFTQLNRGIDTPPGEYNIKVATYEFIYSKTRQQKFTYQVKPGTYVKAEFIAGGQTGQTIYFEADGFCEGVLSEDGLNLNVSCGPPNWLLTAVDTSTTPATKLPIQALFSQSIVGIRVHE
jgi:hypothetical protein